MEVGLMIAKKLSPGLGCFAFLPREDPSRPMRVFYACPDASLRKAPMVIAMHGRDRAAQAFCTDMAAHALGNGQIVLAPEFNLRDFPDHYAYNFGGVCPPPPDHTVFPRDQWSFGIIDRLFQHARHAFDSERTKFGLYGSSAGAQYVLRYMALMEATAVELAVASNSGAYLLPDLDRPYPIGMGGIDLDNAHLRRFLSRPITILVGSDDNDPTAADLPRTDDAIAQGPHRLARGQWYMDHCSQLSERLGTKLAWRMEMVDGAGHISPRVFARASDLLHHR